VVWDEAVNGIILLIIAGAAAALQAPAPSTITCSVRNDPAGRVYRLARKADARGSLVWTIARHTREERDWIELALPGARPAITGTTASLSYTNANGGRHVALDVRPDRAELDVWVDHGLEVNIDPDLDPRVDELTTGGVLRALDCKIE
jgi:hypothetical protein